MIKSADLFTIANSGLRAQNELLRTTGNNIANVNTEGFIRERTSHTSQLTGGVDRATTERVFDKFAQNQLRRDTSVLGLWETYTAKTEQIDNIFANEANSIAASMSRFFASMQTSADDPTNIAARQLVLGQADSMIGQFATMESFMEGKQEELNEELVSVVNRANELIENIAMLNLQVRTTQFSNQFTEPGAVKNQIDQSILELSKILSLETRGNGDGTTLINMTSGQSLVLEDGTFNLFELNGDPDVLRKELTLRTGDNLTTVPLAETALGGRIGGLFQFRDEILDPSRRELGQIALALTDALNEQNNLGMDFDNQLGSDIFTLPQFASLGYSANSATNLSVNARLQDGGGTAITSADYQITIDAVGATLDFTVAFLNPDGTAVTDTAGNPVTQTVTGITPAVGTFTPINGGLELEFPDLLTYAVGDQFLIQPTKNAASQITVAMTRPEDLALASPIRVDSNINNIGDARVSATTVTNTTVDNTFADPNASAFDGAGAIHAAGAGPGGVFGAPADIRFLNATDFEIRDSAGAVITTVTGATNLENLIAQGIASGAGPAWPAAFAAVTGYPGYDLSIEGVPAGGDVFTISYNTNGVDDNRNGLALADLQNQDKMVRDAGGGSNNLITFHEAYSTTIGNIGEKSASAQVALASAEAIERQSRDVFESSAGVNLDEEASNLVRFQQAYAASARVLQTAQTLFETILSSVR